MDDINFVREIVRQLTHPETGVTKHFIPKPITLGEWKQVLMSSYGWVNIGINHQTANIFHRLNIGEVIPSNNPNMDIYNKGFSTYEIGKLLDIYNDVDKKHIVIINYYSFKKIVDILINGRSEEYFSEFQKSLKIIYDDIDPEEFWMRIHVSDEVANYLILNDIGEIIAKNHFEKCISKMIPENNQEDSNCMEEDIKENIKEEIEVDYEYDVDISSEEENEMINNNNQYRLIMNNTSLLSLFTYSCDVCDNIKNDVNVFELMGGDDDELLNIFGKLEI